MPLHDHGSRQSVPSKIANRGDNHRENATPAHNGVTHKGTVLKYSPQMGQGWIRPDKDGADVFLHRNDLVKANMPAPLPTQRLEYEIGNGPQGKPCAINPRSAANQ